MNAAAQLAKNIWNTVSPSRWAALLNQIAPQGDWVDRGVKVCGRCPSHTETTPSAFSILTDRGFAKCLSPACNYFESDPVRIVMKITGESYHEVAMRYFRGFCGVKIPENLQDTLREQVERLETLEAISAAMHQALLLAIRGGARTDLAYLNAGVEYLLSRGVDPNCVASLPIGLCPTSPDLLGMLAPEMALKASALLDNRLPLASHVDHPLLGAVAFFYESAPFEPAGIKLRPLPRAAGPAAPKGNWIGRTEAGLWGVRNAPHLLGSDDPNNPLQSTYIIVEGEFDALSCHLAETRLTRGTPEALYLCASGGGASSLDMLRRMGARHAIILADNDAAGRGVDAQATAGSATHLRRRLQAGSFVAQILEETHLETSVFDWGPLAPTLSSAYKDPDEVVRGGDYVLLREALRDMGPCVMERHHWAVARASSEIAELHTRGGARMQAVAEVLDRYGRLLHDPAHREFYLEALSQEGNVPDALVKTRQGVASNDAQFMAQLTARISDRLLFLAHDTSTGAVLVQGDIASVRLDTSRPSSLLAALTPMIFHGGVVAWTHQHMGLPSFVTTPIVHGKPTPADVIKQEEILGKYIVTAVRNLASTTPAVSTLTEVKQGLHFDPEIRPSQDETGPPDCCGLLLLVNGPRVYRAWASPTTAPRWEPTRGVAGRFLPTTSPETWSALGADDLRSIPPGGLRPVFDRLYECIHRGWTFSPDPDIQRMEAMFLTAFFLYVPAAMLFPTTCLTFLTAPAQSGKSSLLLGLAGKIERPECHVIEAGRGFSVYTMAAIEQFAHGTSLLACIDELEETESDPQRREITLNLLSMLRGLGTSGGAQRVKGTADGRGIKSQMRFPLLAAAINPPTNEANLSRFNFIALHRETRARPNPETIVQEILGGKTGVDRFRRNITHVVLTYLDQIIAARDHVLAQPWLRQTPHANIDSRFRDVITPVLCMLHACDEDAQGFWTQYCVFKGAQRAQYTSKAWERVLGDVLHTPAVRVTGQAQAISVSSCLQHPALLQEMHAAGVGVYKICVTDPEKRVHEVLALHGAKLLATVLTRTTHGNGSPQGLLQILRQCPHALSTRQIEAWNVLAKLKTFFYTRVSASDFVVILATGIAAGSAPREEAEDGDRVIRLPARPTPVEDIDIASLLGEE